MRNELVEKIITISGSNPYLCYQCGMCTAVCPVSIFMKTKPHQIIRYIQLGKIDLEKLESVWTCISCMACVDRCPRHVNPGIIFEAVRNIVLRKGVDAINYNRLSGLEEVPSMALVALSRKMTG